MTRSIRYWALVIITALVGLLMIAVVHAGIQESGGAIAEIVSWIVYLNVGAVLLAVVGGPILIYSLKKWISSLVSTAWCEMTQAKCRLDLAKSLADKFQNLEQASKTEHGMIYDKITENRENAVKNFRELRQEITDGLKNLTNLLIGHIQKNGG